MPQKVQIRAAELSDVDAVGEVFSCPGVIAGTLQIPWRSTEHTRERLSRRGPNDHQLVATIDGRVVGQLGLHIAESPRRRDVAAFGMAVHDDFQGQGIGSALMAAMIDLADNWLGLRRLELEVWADNRPAIHLYEKFGFTVEGTAQQYGRRAGVLVDASFMARLRPTG